MATKRMSRVTQMFNLIHWDDTNKMEAVVESLEKLGDKHPEALQQFLEIFLAEHGTCNHFNVGDCAICAWGVVFELVDKKLVYRCLNTRCENHRV